LYQFEIFLKDDVNLLTSFRQSDETTSNQENQPDSPMKTSQVTVQESKLMKKPPLHHSPSLQSFHRSSWSYREFEWWLAERRFLFSAKSKEEAESWVSCLKIKLKN
jgi:hypothetical protein